MCKFWISSSDNYQVGKLIHFGLGSACSAFNGERHYTAICDYKYTNCEVLREKGIKQPYFQGDDVPDIDHKYGFLIYFDSGYIKFITTRTELQFTDWSEVIAYIEV